MKRQIIISIVGFVLIIAVGFLAFRAMTGKKQKEPAKQNFEATKYVNVQKVEYADNQFKLITNGRLNSKNSIDIFSEVQGLMKMESGNFRVGNSFRKGDILISIDDEESKLQLMTMKSDFLNLLAMAMPDIKADFPSAFSKWSDFIEKIDIHKQLPELPQYDNGKEKFFLAGRKILGQYYNIRNMEVRLNKYVIRAPFDGTVTASMVETGTLIRPGQKLGEFAGIGSFEFEIALNPIDADLVNVGSQVKITNQSDIFQGNIIRKSANIDPVTQTIKAFVQVSGSNLSDGMYLKAEISGRQIPNSILIPRRAIINNSYVYTDNNGKLGKSYIELLALSSEDAYINGIDEGTYIITDPLVNPTIGMKIEQIKK